MRSLFWRAICPLSHLFCWRKAVWNQLSEGSRDGVVGGMTIEKRKPTDLKNKVGQWSCLCIDCRGVCGEKLEEEPIGHKSLRSTFQWCQPLACFQSLGCAITNRPQFSWEAGMKMLKKRRGWFATSIWFPQNPVINMGNCRPDIAHVWCCMVSALSMCGSWNRMTSSIALFSYSSVYFLLPWDVPLGYCTSSGAGDCHWRNTSVWQPFLSWWNTRSNVSSSYWFGDCHPTFNGDFSHRLNPNRARSQYQCLL